MAPITLAHSACDTVGTLSQAAS